MFTAISIILALLIIGFTGVKRFILYFISLIFIPYVVPVTSSPNIDAHRLFIIALLISLIIHKKSFLAQLSSFPLKWPLALIFMSYLITAFMDQRISETMGLYRTITVYIDTFLGVILGYLAIENYTDAKKLLKSLILLSFIITTYGILTIIFKVDPFTALVENSTFFESDFGFGSTGRERAVSFLFNSHIFGATCCALLLTLFFAKKHAIIESRLTYIIATLLIISIILSNSRTNMIAALFSSLIWISYGVSFKKKLRLYLIGGLSITIIIILAPVIYDRIAFFSDILKETGGDTGGSSIDMRITQMGLSFQFFLQNPIWGNGFYYFGEVLKADEYLIIEEGLYGAESYLFILLIEGGLIQLITIPLFFILLYRNFIKSKHFSKTNTALGLALTVSFLIISFLTGNNAKWEFFMPLIGFSLKLIQLDFKIYNLIYNETSIRK